MGRGQGVVGSQGCCRKQWGLGSHPAGGPCCVPVPSTLVTGRDGGTGAGGVQTAKASRKQSSLSGKESAQGCIPKRLPGRRRSADGIY